DIIKENEKFKLLICGSGPEEENLKKLVGRLDVGPNIMFAGMVEQSKLWQKLCCCAFVLNSGYEGLSHTILEAMAVGTPVIASNVGGNPELITHGHNGLLIEYDNKDQIKKAILTLHNNEELRKRFIENSKKVLEKFSYENMINQTINILKSY
ncbi:glycosyltransferase family 4 protein, partial [Candidatus Falkowbacteria bacterium]|nr:glycosyltransferase family 4 protein [Candidatus Falkowbacteria bacterium]